MAASDAVPSRVSIRYCTQCQWLLRAGWMAQEVLSTFGQQLSEVALLPGSGGIYQIWCGETLVWDRQREGGFPDAAEIKRRIRDIVEPGRELGHIDGR